jgi:hypothetical protein
MATYIYRQASSTSARALADSVEGRRWRRAAPPAPLRAGDVVVCWGEAAPPVPAGVLVVNGGPIRNKFTDAGVLAAANVRTIEVSRTRPAAPAPAARVAGIDPVLALWETAQDLAGDFTEIEAPSRTPVLTTGITGLITALTALNQGLGRPAPVAPPAVVAVDGTWLPRMNNHIGGNDLLSAPATPDYFARRLTLVNEFRIHSFDGRSIRAGRKVLRDGYHLPGTPGDVTVASPWIRSFDGGWRINYDGFESTRAQRELAAAACAALGLTFGAVDIGQLADNSLVVLEVNRAPGLEGNSLTSYGTALTRYITEHGTTEQRRAAA